MNKIEKEGWVSIVMGCYNGSKYIDRSFSSVLAQTYPYIQLIVVNDGSTDDSLLKAESYRPLFVEKGYELLILSQENQGPGFACKTGIEAATGEFYGYLDVDDAITPNSIEKKVNILRANPDYNIVKTNAYRVFEHENDRKEILITEEWQKQCTRDAFEAYVMATMDNYAGTYIVRARVINEFYSDREFLGSRFGQNLQLLMPAAYKNGQLFIDEPLMYYYMHDDSHSHKKLLSDYLRLLEGYNQIRTAVLNQFDEPMLNLKKRQHQRFLCHVLDSIVSYGVTPLNASQYNDFYLQLKRHGGTTIQYDMYYALYNGQRIKAILLRLMYFIYRRLL